MTQTNKSIGFIHIPKTGGKSFLEYLKTQGLGYKYNLHNPISELWDRGNNELYNITLVRHPYDRVLSFYSFYKKFENSPFSNLGFDEYISKLENISPYIRPCYDFCTIDDVNVMDFIIKLENIHDDLEMLCEKLSLNPKIPFPYQNKNDGYLVDKLNGDHKKIITQVFKNDFEYFNYGP